MSETQLGGRALVARQRALIDRGIAPGPVVVACGLQINDNIGGLLRLAEAAGCAEVIFVGEVELDRRGVRHAARGGDRMVPSRVLDPAAFASLAPTLPPLIAVEITDRSMPLFGAGSRPLPAPCAIMLGSEQHGIPDALLAMCARSVHIPMFGLSGSMNVIMAAGIVLFEWRRQHADD